MSSLPKTFITPEEYLERERKAEHKSEYHDGKIHAMAGASHRHDEIVAQLSTLMGTHLRGKGCRWYTADLRVLAESWTCPPF
jgi:Uma2 family endonuclease